MEFLLPSELFNDGSYETEKWNILNQIKKKLEYYYGTYYNLTVQSEGVHFAGPRNLRRT